MYRFGVCPGLCVIFLCFAFASCGDNASFYGGGAAYGVSAQLNGQSLQNNVIRSIDMIHLVVESDDASSSAKRFLEAVFVDSKDRPVAEPVEFYEALAAGSRSLGSGARLVDNIGDRLDSFSPPQGLAPGYYQLRIRISDDINPLFEKRFECYYLGEARLVLDQVLSYPPGPYPSMGKPLYPVGMFFLLRADIDVDPRLDPYIVWSLGDKVIGGGLLSKGADRLLWLPPMLGGFHHLSAKLYPSAPRSDGKLPPLADEAALKITTSPDGVFTAPLKPESPYLAWYPLLGNLGDAAASNRGGAEAGALKADSDRDSVWLPTLSSYGLAVGMDRSYSAYAIASPAVDGYPRPFRLELRAMPTQSAASPALLLSAAFPLSDGYAQFALKRDYGAVSLWAKIGASRVIELSVPLLNTETPTDLCIDVDTDRLGEALYIRLALDGRETEAVRVETRSRWLGQGIIRLGGRTLASEDAPLYHAPYDDSYRAERDNEDEASVINSGTADAGSTVAGAEIQPEAPLSEAESGIDQPTVPIQPSDVFAEAVYDALAPSEAEVEPAEADFPGTESSGTEFLEAEFSAEKLVSVDTFDPLFNESSDDTFFTSPNEAFETLPGTEADTINGEAFSSAPFFGEDEFDMAFIEGETKLETPENDDLEEGEAPEADDASHTDELSEQVASELALVAGEDSSLPADSDIGPSLEPAEAQSEDSMNIETELVSLDALPPSRADPIGQTEDFFKDDSETSREAEFHTIIETLSLRMMEPGFAAPTLIMETAEPGR